MSFSFPRVKSGEENLKVSSYSCHEPRMFLKCFFINQVQITTPMLMRLKPAPFKATQQLQKIKSSAHIKCGQGFINKIEMCCVMNHQVLKILSKIVWFLKNYFLQIPKSQPDYVSYMIFLYFEPFVSKKHVSYYKKCALLG